MCILFPCPCLNYSLNLWLLYPCSQPLTPLPPLPLPPPLLPPLPSPLPFPPPTPPAFQCDNDKSCGCEGLGTMFMVTPHFVQNMVCLCSIYVTIDNGYLWWCMYMEL